MILTGIWRAVTANITNLSFYKPNFPFYATITSFLCYKTSSPFYKIKLRILKLRGYHNINIYILVLIFHNIKLNGYYKTRLLNKT